MVSTRQVWSAARSVGLVETMDDVASSSRSSRSCSCCKPRWLVFNKADAVEDADARIRKVLARLRWKRPWFKVCAISAQGTAEVCKAIARELAKK